MSKSVQLRRGTSDQHSNFTGAVGEVTVDTTLNILRVHDGYTVGGHQLAPTSNPSFTGTITSGQINFSNTFTALGSFPTASAYPGMVGYNQADNHLYYSNGTTFIKLSQPSDLTGFVTNAINLGTAGDATLFTSLSGSNLQFRTLRAGTNMALQVDQATNAVIINGPTYTFNNSSDGGTTYGIYSTTSGSNQVNLRSIAAGTGISITTTANQITVSSQVSTSFKNVNVGGTLAFSSSTATDSVNFAASGGLTATSSGNNTVTFGTSFTVANDSSQTGSGVLESYSAGNFKFNKIQAGSGILLSTGANGEIVVSNQYNGTITGAANLNPPSSTSLGLYKSTTSGVLGFYNISAGSNITIAYDGPGNNLIISAATGGSAGVGTVQTGTATYLAYYPSTGTAVGAIGSGAYWSSADNTIHANITGTVSSLSNLTTSNLAEGSNLYYTQARFDTAFGNKTTTNLAEGTNLYFTNSRAQVAAETMMLAGNPALTTVSTTATAGSNSTSVLTFASTSGIVTAMTLSGSGITGTPAVQSLTGTTVTVSPAVYVPTGGSVTFTNAGTSLTLTTIAPVTSSAVISVASVAGIVNGYQITATGVTGKSLVTSIGGNSVTVQPGYNVSIASSATVNFTSVPTTGLYGAYSTGSFTYQSEPNYIQNLARSAINVVSGQGLIYDSNSGLIGLSGAVTSVNGYTGSVTLRVADIIGAAPSASPILTGTPQVPTPTGGTTGAIVNVNYLNAQLLGVTGTPPTGLTTIAALASAINNDVNYSTTISTQFGTKLSLSGGVMTGALQLSADPTSGSSPQQAATKNYVDTKATVQSVNSLTGTITLTTDYIQERSSPAPVNLYFTNARARASFNVITDATLGSSFYSYSTNDGNIRLNPVTDAISEGTTNLYFTISRVRNNISIQQTSSGNLLQYNSSSGVFSFNPSSDALTQGTSNLFFSNSLARSAISLSTNTSQVGFLSYSSSTGQFVINPTTTNLTEGSNLFFTTSRVTGAISLTTSGSQTSFLSYSNGVFTQNPITTYVTEGTNLYYTDSRARASLSVTSDNGSLFTYNSTSGAFTFNTPKTNNVTEGSGVLYLLPANATTPSRVITSFEAQSSIAQVKALLTATSVASISVTNYGTGYTTVPTVVIGGSLTGVVLSSKGSGYATAPLVSFPAPTGNASGVTATGYAVMDNLGRVSGVVITNPGSGYTGTVTVTFTGGGYTITAAATATVAAGSGATATAVLGTATGYTTSVFTINVTGAGSGYTDAPVVTFSGGGGTGATAVALCTATSIQTTTTIVSPGAGYQGTPTVVFSGGGGSGATGSATVTSGVVTAINIINGGSGYTGVNSVSVSGGSGFSGTVIVSGGVIVGVDITAGGNGFSSTSIVTITGTLGSGAQAFPVVSSVLTGITIGAQGSGYTSAPKVYIQGGGVAASQAVAYDRTYGAIYSGNTDGLPEGPTNLYYTDARARAAHSVTVTTASGGSSSTALTYNSNTGLITLNANTDSITEGSSNQYFTKSRVGSSITLTAPSATSYTLVTAGLSLTSAGSTTAATLSGTGGLSTNTTYYIFPQLANNQGGLLPYTTFTTPGVVSSSITLSQATTAAFTTMPVNIYSSSLSANPLVGYTSGSVTFTANTSTDALTEGNINLFYQDRRARASISMASGNANYPLQYSSVTGVLTFNFTVDSNFVYNSTGSTNLSLAQNITTTSTPQFQGVKFGNSGTTGTYASPFTTSATLDLSKGSMFYFAPTSSISLPNPTNVPSSGVYQELTMVFATSTSSGQTITFPSAFRMPLNLPGSSTAANAITKSSSSNSCIYTLNGTGGTYTTVWDVFKFATFDGGTNWVCVDIISKCI
jgi:Major tropism determinant N-terminal domain